MSVVVQQQRADEMNEGLERSKNSVVTSGRNPNKGGLLLSVGHELAWEDC